MDNTCCEKCSEWVLDRNVCHDPGCSCHSPEKNQKDCTTYGGCTVEGCKNNFCEKSEKDSFVGLIDGVKDLVDKKKSQELEGWAKERKNLEAMVKKYPNILIDCLDSAYLAGLEAKAFTLKAELVKKLELTTEGGYLPEGDDGREREGYNRAIKEVREKLINLLKSHE